MIVSSWLQAAMLSERWNVAGVQCRALSVWHVYCLWARGNAFVCNDTERMDMDAAAELLLYASRSHAEALRLFASERYRVKAFNAIRRIIAPRGRLQTWLWGKKTWYQILDECIFYSDASRRVPAHKGPTIDLTTHQSNSRPAAAPVAWMLVNHLSAGNPDKIEAAWNTPYAVACCLFDAHRDIEGKDTTLETPDEELREDARAEKRRAL